MTELNEQKLQEEIIKTRAERESYFFMKRHVSDFLPCQANSDVLTQFMQDHNLEWTQENLEIAFENCKNQLATSSIPKLALITTEPPADALPPAPANANWPTTKAEIQAMSQTDYRREFHNKQTGAAFRQRINAVLQRGI